MRPPKPSRSKTSTSLCFTCVNDRENLITIDKYCSQHKNRDENNEKQINDKQNNQDVR